MQITEKIKKQNRWIDERIPAYLIHVPRIWIYNVKLLSIPWKLNALGNGFEFVPVVHLQRWATLLYKIRELLGSLAYERSNWFVSNFFPSVKLFSKTQNFDFETVGCICSIRDLDLGLIFVNSYLFYSLMKTKFM